MSMFFGNDVDKFVEICIISLSKKLKQCDITVPQLRNAENVISLWLCNTLSSSKLRNKCIVRYDVVQKMNTVGSQTAHLSIS